MKLLVFLPILALLTFGCGGGGGSGSSGGSYCKPDYDPVSLVDKDSGVIEVDLLADGTYEFDATEVYYNDIENEIRIHMSYKKNKKGEYVGEAVCVGGLGIAANMTPTTFEVDLVSEIVKDAGGKTLAKSKTASIDLRPRPAGSAWLKIEVKDSDTVGRSGKLSDYYKSGNKSSMDNIKQVVIRKSSTETHLRSHFEVASNGKPGQKKIQVGVKYNQLP